jgi:hypothetical protein
MDDVVVWRSLALEKMPYLASTLLTLRPLDAPDLGTFAVDAALRLYIDFETVTSKGPVWSAEALLHECCHVFGDHAARSEDAAVTDAEQQTCNLSGDAEINDDLVAAGCKTIEADGILPGSLGEQDHQTAEVYLAALRRRRASRPARESNSCPGGSQTAKSGAQPSAGGHGQLQPTASFAGCGSGSGGTTAPCELDPGDDLGGLAPAATDAEKIWVRVATAAHVRDHAAKQPGSTPGGLVEIAAAVLAPSKLPWRQVLSSAIRRAVAIRQGDFDATWSRRNRRRPSVELAPGRHVVVPGTFSPTPTLAVIRDTAMFTASCMPRSSQFRISTRASGSKPSSSELIRDHLRECATRPYCPLGVGSLGPALVAVPHTRESTRGLDHAPDRRVADAAVTDRATSLTQ